MYLSDNKQNNIEKLAGLGYWEYWLKDKHIHLSDGAIRVLSFIDDDLNFSSIAKYLKNNNVRTAHDEVFQYFDSVKKGKPATVKTLTLIDPQNNLRYFELNAFVTSNGNQKYVAGTIQEITDKIKYNHLKEKEILFERKISEIASRFVTHNDYTASITSTLNEVGDLCQAGLVYLFRIENNVISEEFRWQNPFERIEAPVLEAFPPRETKYLIELLKEQKLIYYHKLDEMPGIAQGIKESLKQKQVESLAMAAINNEKQTIGAMVILKNIPHSKWDFSDIHIIKMTSLLISNTIKQHIIYKQLKQSEQRLQFALLAGNLGTWEYDFTQQRYYFDERYANIFGHSNNTLNKIPNWLKNNIHHEDVAPYYKAIDACVSGSQKFYTMEYRVLSKNGKYKWIQDWGIVTRVNSEGEPQIIVGIIQDISQKKQADEELIKAKEKAEENDKLKSAFLANVSHEIRTPMNGITGFAELLYNNMVSENEKHQYLEIIWKSSNQLLGLINNIIDISKLETRQLRLFKRECLLNDLFENIQRHFATTFNQNPLIEFRIQLQPDTLQNYINTDESRLHQIIVNLVNHALYYTSKGYIEVGYKIIENEHIEFTVTDTGTGIPYEYQNHIFDRFVQSNPALTINEGGVGLGLPISRGLVELLGGKIWLKSMPGIGTTIYFTLPYEPTRMKIENMG